QRQVRVDGTPCQLQLVVVAPRLRGGERLVRWLPVDRRQHVATAGKEHTVDRRDDVGRFVDGAVQQAHLTTSTSNRFFVVVQLGARRNRDHWHGYILVGTATPIRSSA